MAEIDGFGYWELKAKDEGIYNTLHGIVDTSNGLFIVTDKDGNKTGEVFQLTYFGGWKKVKEEGEDISTPHSLFDYGANA